MRPPPWASALPPILRSASLRSRLLAGILVPVLALVALNAYLLYEQALDAADTAYDRTLLASAKSLGELLVVRSDGQSVRLESSVPYAALEPFEADNRSRLYYRVVGFQGEVVSGFEDFPAWQGRLPDRGPYAALVDFYDDIYRGDRIRVAVLLQPVAGADGQGIATIQVAETLELREALARSFLIDTLWRQALIVAVIAAVVIGVVQRVTRPVRDLSEQLAARRDGDLQPIEAWDAPPELNPLIVATNEVMARLSQLLQNQKRFIRDASHQLRTPLAVLKTQVQSARRGDVPATIALAEIQGTVERATELANQMLALAKVDQMVDDAAQPARQDAQAPPVVDWAEVAREVALDLAPLMVERRLDFSITTEPAWVRSHAWPLRELVRNLMHNAIRFSPDGQALALDLRRLDAGGGTHAAALRVSDSGPGLSQEQRQRLFTPFASGPPPVRASGEATPGGTGLGLVICQGIVKSLGGRLSLENRAAGDEGAALGLVVGLDAVAVLPVEPPLEAPNDDHPADHPEAIAHAP